MKSASKYLYALSLLLTSNYCLYAMEEKSDKSVGSCQNSNETCIYTETTRDLLRKTFHVLEQGVIPSDDDDLTPSKSGRKPEITLTNKVMCTTLINCRMKECFEECRDSKSHKEKLSKNGQFLLINQFNSFVDLNLQKYTKNRSKKDKVKDLNDYLVEVTRNAYQQNLIVIKNATIKSFSDYESIRETELTLAKAQAIVYQDERDKEKKNHKWYFAKGAIASGLVLGIGGAVAFKTGLIKPGNS